MPELGKLLSLIDSLLGYPALLDKLERKENRTVVVLDAARTFLLAALHRDLKIPVLIVTAQPENAKKLKEQLSSWGDASSIQHFPETDALPYERLATDATTDIERVQVLTALAGFGSGGNGVLAPLVITSAPALMGKTPEPEAFVSTIHKVELGMEIDPMELLRRWELMGYQTENVVEVPGAVSHRGGIIDIFPPTGEMPVRLEFFGDTIDSLRYFSPETQRSVGNTSSVTIGPATELLMPLLMDKESLKHSFNEMDLRNCTDSVKKAFQGDMEMLLERQRPPEMQFYVSLFQKHCLLDYLPEEALLVIDEPSAMEQAVAELDEEAVQLCSGKIDRGELPVNFPRPYFTWDEIRPALDKHQNLRLDAWGVDEPRLAFMPAPMYSGQLPPFLQKTSELIGQQKRVIVISHQAERLAELLYERDIIAAPVESVGQLPEPGSLLLVQGSLAEGWMMGDDVYLFTDSEIFGFVKERRVTKKHSVPAHKLMAEINPGDYVVHIEHGIGKFTGMTTFDAAGSDKEYLVLQYAMNDILYVPTDQIDRIDRYIGASDRQPVLSRLGTQEWYRTRQKAKEAAEELAKELLALYAAREVVPGYAFSRDSVWQQEMEAAFPYVETRDQLQAQQDVKADMEKAKPMDRLVCGDVGYGKTEVAIRAAFKAVMDGRQVAVLVPTTVLAQQHYATFSERLEVFPIKVEVLSRFRSTSEQHAIVRGLADGTVDICIGTHRLIQKDIKFKDLGLLIIDEEQRFGVNHKEYLKKMRQEVDVLTLSATPIPRTLHMSLVGVRDMSTMETPPETRLPVRTYVAAYDEFMVREAILRELERNGQVFFVHNRVQSIWMIAEHLRDLVPEATVGIGHGQMPEQELEKVMTEFSRGKIDILICTTIIESGLDIPNVNTLIVNRADRFGLTQLYQLRGRVGRGTNLAYAYFLYDNPRALTPVARQRLATIYEATELGAGFGIAMRDLEIRGAGTLLGHRQSGHITAVGFNLYTRLLAEAVEDRKARIAGEEKPPRLPAPAIDLPLDAYIPEDYVPDVNSRLELYRDLAHPDAHEKLDDLAAAYLDRFGAVPEEVENLVYAVRIKGLAARAGIETVTTEEGHITLRRFQGLPFDRDKLEPVLKDGITVGRTLIKIYYQKLGRTWKRVLEEVIGAV